MTTNSELTTQLAFDLGIKIKNRRPTAKETFKWLDIDLLPHSSADTLLCEIYEWNARNWRTTGENLIGEIFKGDEIQEIKSKLVNVQKEFANVPDFEITKDDLFDIGLELPALLGIGLKGDVQKAKEFSIKVNKVTKSRITNIDEPGIQIMNQLAEFLKKHKKKYRRKIKRNYIVKALFYAESVEIYLKKDAEVEIEVGLPVDNVEVKTEVDTATKKQIQLKYSGRNAPFAATLVLGKDFDL